MAEAANILQEQFFRVANVDKIDSSSSETPPIPNIPMPIYNMPVERLDLSSRVLNCLKRANIDRVGEILGKSKVELLRMRNFGETSYKELYARLRDMDLLPPEFYPELAQNEVEE